MKKKRKGRRAGAVQRGGLAPILSREYISSIQTYAVILRLRQNIEPRLQLRKRSEPWPCSHGTRPVHQIISMTKGIRTSRLSIKNSFSGPWPSRRTLISRVDRVIHMYTYIYIYVYVHKYIYVYIYIYMYIYISAYTYICVSIYLFIYLSIYLSIYLYIYIHRGRGPTPASSTRSPFASSAHP